MNSEISKTLRNIVLMLLGGFVFMTIFLSVVDATSPSSYLESEEVTWQDDYEKLYTRDYDTETIITVNSEEGRKENSLKIKVNAEISDENEIEGTLRFDNIGLLGSNETDKISFYGDRDEITFETETPVTLEVPMLFMPIVAEAKAEYINTDCEEEILSLISLVNPALAEELKGMEMDIRENIYETSGGTKGDIFMYSGLSAEGEAVLIPSSKDSERYDLDLSMRQSVNFENEYERLEEIEEERPGFFGRFWHNITHPIEMYKRILEEN